MIFMAKDVQRDQPTLNLVDIQVERNAFGRQKDSFEMLFDIHFKQQTLTNFPGVFIRAPIITQTTQPVDVLAKLPDGKYIAAQQNNLLVTSFHPELTHDSRMHEFFLAMCNTNKQKLPSSIT